MNQHDEIFGMPISYVRAILADVCRQVAVTGRPLAIRRYSKAHVVIVPLDEWQRLKALDARVNEGAIGPTQPDAIEPIAAITQNA
jgi:hypothetical protein